MHSLWRNRPTLRRTRASPSLEDCTTKTIGGRSSSLGLEPGLQTQQVQLPVEAAHPAQADLAADSRDRDLEEGDLQEGKNIFNPPKNIR